MLWSTVSNAALRSNRTSIDTSLLSEAKRRSFVTVTPRWSFVSFPFFVSWLPVLFWKVTLLSFQVPCLSFMCHRSDCLPLIPDCFPLFPMCLNSLRLLSNVLSITLAIFLDLDQAKVIAASFVYLPFASSWVTFCLTFWDFVFLLITLFYLLFLVSFCFPPFGGILILIFH